MTVVGLLGDVMAWHMGSGAALVVWGLLLGGLVSFTLVVIIPINRGLLDPRLDPGSGEAGESQRWWGRLHAVRTFVSVAAFVAFVPMSLGS